MRLSKSSDVLKAGVRLALKDGPVELEAVSSVMHWDGKLPIGAHWICHFMRENNKPSESWDSERKEGKHKRTCMWTQHISKNKGG